MTLPVVKGELVRSIGEQMCNSQEYLAVVEREFVQENPHLAQVSYNSLNTIDAFIDNEEGRLAAKVIGHTTLLLMYHALKQQQICDELSDD